MPSSQPSTSHHSPDTAPRHCGRASRLAPCGKEINQYQLIARYHIMKCFHKSLFFISLLSQHPFPRRKNMNLLAIYLKFFLLLHRKNISLSQAISIHGFHQPLDFALARFLLIHGYRYLRILLFIHLLPCIHCPPFSAPSQVRGCNR